jgi:lysophospholipase L1-like esterase/pimeloyl-ACP methyl ester carboxylesterase
MIFIRAIASLLLLFSLIVNPAASQQHRVRIACVGGSTTYGDNMQSRNHNAYPPQLQEMLGNEYQVLNLGVSEVESRSDKQIISMGITNLLKYKPDMIFFLPSPVGDSNEVNTGSVTVIVNQLRSKFSNARIVLLLPPAAWNNDNSESVVPFTKQMLIPSLQDAAYKSGCEIIDLNFLFDGRSDLFPDKVHMSSLGATLIAKRLYEAVKLTSKPIIDIPGKITMEKKASSFYGYQRVDFVFSGRQAIVVRPKLVADGMPWIWRARFWGHEPQADIALLERGFHLVYCDVSELYGNDEAISIWNRFYEYMHQLGLSKKVVLEGMSRGGVYIYNWALANPGKVACIYADAPVLDLSSWPGGKGKGPGSKEDWEIFKKDYTLTEEQAVEFKGSPLQKAEAIAKLNFPMLHVVGDADEVVPVDENTNPFETVIKKAGGNITVIHKPGVGHHPHSLANPSPIVDFILRSTGYKTNFAALPAPGSEYRSGAGWAEGTGWWDNNADINKLLANRKNLDVLFVGNSITQGIAGNRSNLTYKPGLAVFDSVFKKYAWESAGISGDRTQHVLWRLQHGNYKLNRPKLLVLTIGVNNFPDDNPDEVAAGIKSIVDWIKKNMPAIRLMLIGPLPAGVRPNEMLRQKYEAVQSLIRDYGDNRSVFYFPLAEKFIRADGSLDPELCSSDGIHLEAGGYRAWAIAMKPMIERLLSK